MIFSNVKEIEIPEGTVTKIVSGGITLWESIKIVIDSFVDTFTYIGGSIKSLVQHGKCVQNGTPTPSAPVDIKCNNGTIMLSPNLFRTTATSKTQAGVRYEVLPDGRIQCTGTATGYSDIAVGRAKVNSEMGVIRVVVDGTYGNMGNIVVSGGIGLYNSGGTKIASLTYNTWTQYITVDLSEYPTVDTVRVEIKRNSNSETNAIIAVSVTVGSAAVSWYQYGVPIIKGTREAITIGQQTARAQNLLGVGDIADTQDIISGEIGRNYGITVLDGTEEWTFIADNYQDGTHRIHWDGFRTLTTITTSDPPVLCSHFAKAPLADRAVQTGQDGKFYLSSISFHMRSTNFTSLATAKAWLAEQYAKGTPVIIVYPLREPTTESVTAQPLDPPSGTNTISVTAEVSGINFDIEYYK